jgi:hypothetical protein
MCAVACIHLRLTILGYGGCVAVSSFLGVPLTLEVIEQRVKNACQEFE